MKRLPLFSCLVIGTGMLSAVALAYLLPPENWDEARRGVNALEMLCSGDYLNYSYLGEPDTFNTKPPLFLWMVTGSFHLFGVGVFSLRLPSLLALMGFLLYVHRWIRQRFGAYRAFLTVTALVVVNGIIGQHVGISGDTDMLFVFLLTVGCCEWFGYLEGGQRRSALVSAACFALAFLTKGVACFLVIPGLVLASFLHPKQTVRLRSSYTWQAAAFLCVLGVGCGVLLSRMGTRMAGIEGYGTLLEAMLGRDGLQRFGDPQFEQDHNPFFVFTALDIRFGPLIYVIYLGMLAGMIRYGWRAMLPGRGSFASFSLCIVVSVLLLLQFSANRHNWYVAPALPFLAYLFARMVEAMVHRRGWMVAALLCLVVLSTFQRARAISAREELIVDSSMTLDDRLPQAKAFRLLISNPPCHPGGE